MGFRVSSYRAPAYTKTFTKSYAPSYSAKTVVTRPSVTVHTTIVHQPIISHSWGWNPWYTTPVVVSTPIVATQPVMDVAPAMPQPVYYQDTGYGAVGLVLTALIVALVGFVVMKRSL